MRNQMEYYVSDCGRIGRVTGDEAGYWCVFDRLRDAVAYKQRQEAAKEVEGIETNCRPCNCGSGVSWIECTGLDGDWSYCG